MQELISKQRKSKIGIKEPLNRGEVSKAPPFLIDLQSWFSRIETFPLTPSEFPNYPPEIKEQITQKITDGPNLNAEQRIGIYNQQYWWRLWEILQNHYPSLVRIFGPQDFNDTIATPYLTKYPPNSWDLHTLGTRLPEWIQKEYQEEDIHLILPLAQIDEAHQRIPYEQQLRPATKITEISRLTLQPFISLFSLHADLFTFRKMLIDQDKNYWEKNEFPEITKNGECSYFVLYKQGIDLEYKAIDKSEYILLNAFKNGATIAEALSYLSGEETDNQIGDWFQSWTSQQWLCLHPNNPIYSRLNHKGGFSLGSKVSKV